MKVALRYLGVLWRLQIISIVFAQVTFNWLPAALLVTAGYLYLAGRMASSLREDVQDVGHRLSVAAVVALLWQLPGLAGSVNLFRETMRWTQYDHRSDLLDLIMQTWQTPVMAALSLLPARETRWHLAPYYLGMAAAAPLLIVLFTALALPAAPQSDDVTTGG